MLNRINVVINPPLSWIRTLFAYSTGLIVVLQLAMWAFRENLLGIFSNQLPLAGDGTFTAIFLRSVKESTLGQIFTKQLSVDSLGWPNKLDFVNYPIGNTLDLIWIKLLFLLNDSIHESTIIHSVSILKVVLIYTSTFFVCKKLDLNNSLASVSGALFSLSSFNLIRSEGHFFLGLTWTIPLGLYLTIISINRLRQITPHNGPSRLYSILAVAFVVGFSSFYYSIFFLIIQSLLLLLFLLRSLLTSDQETLSINLVFRRSITFIKSCKVFFVSIAGICLGLAVQIIPVYLGQQKILSTAKVSDRSFTEPIVYSGNLQSLFFDFSRIVLHLFEKEEVLNFLRTQISWEGAQAGFLTGALILLLIIVGLLNLTKFKDHQPTLLRFPTPALDILTIFLISLSLYFAGPLNYFISMFLPQIRAWGRISVLLSLLSIMLVSYLIQFYSRNKRTEILLIAALLMPGLAEVASFREARPPSANLNEIAVQVQDEREISVNYLLRNLPEDCPLAVLPLTPFPEFDNPADNTGDYSYFDLPLATSGRFEWMNGSFKNTWENRFFEPLYSQQPNFVRSTIEFQVSYVEAMSACGAIIDRTALTSSEREEVSALKDRLAENLPDCMLSIPGEIFQESPRFILYKLTIRECKDLLKKEAKYFWSLTNSNNFVWRIDSPFAQKMISSFQLFPTNLPIAFRLKANDRFRSNQQAAIIVRHYRSSNVPDFKPREFCISTLRQAEICSLSRNVSGDQVILLPQRFIETGISTLSIRSKNPESSMSWGVFLATLDPQASRLSTKTL